MKTIVVVTRRFLDKFRCIDSEKIYRVPNKPAIIQGSLEYYKLNEFNYLVVSYNKNNGKYYR